MSKEKKSSEELLEEISEKLDKIVALIAIQGKEEDAQIRILKKLGMKSEEVGDLLGVKGRARDRKGWKED